MPSSQKSTSGNLTPQASLSFPIACGALFIGAVAMGSSPVFVRYAEVGPFASAFWRATLALPLLFLWAYFETRKNDQSLRNTLKIDRAILLGGVFFAGDLFFWHLAILNTTITNATLLSCLAPVWVALFSGLFIGEPVSKSTTQGLIICLAGTLLLIGSTYSISPEQLLGDIYGIITSMFFGLYFLCVRVGRRTHGAGALTFASTCVTASVLFVVVLISGQSLIPATMTGVLALLALGFISHSGGQGLLSVALGSLSATFSSLVIFVEALAAAVLGWLVFDEHLTILQFAGAMLILFGIWIARPKDR